MTTKPPYGDPCNGCGECCRRVLCPLAEMVIGRQDGPCPALMPDGEKSGCGLILDPAAFAPVLTALRGPEAMSAAAIILTGAGLGCDAVAPGENPQNQAAVSLRLRMAAEPLRPHARSALRIWGIRP